MQKNLFCTSAIAGGASLALAVAASAGVLSDWNLTVRGDVMSTSEVDGSALVGGSLGGSSSNYAVHAVTASNGDGLALGGSINVGSIQVNNGGNLRIAGAGAGAANLNGGGSVITDPTVSSMIASAFAEMEAASAHLAGLAPNGSLSGSGHLSASPVLLGGQSVAVYSIAATDLSSLGQLTLDIGAADSVIINVAADASGLVDLQAPPNILNDFSQANSSRILWNFPDATDLVVNNSMSGAVLAPYADLRLLGGGINGSVVVDSVSQMNAEVRLNVYGGYVPSPGAATLFGLSGVIAMRRRRTA